MKKNMITFKQETKYTCGAASLRTILACLGIKRSEKQIARLVGTNKISGESPKHLERAVQKLKLKCIFEDRSNWSELMRAIKTHHILIGYWLRTDDTGHYSVVETVTPTSITMYDPWDDKLIRYKRSYFYTVWCRGFRYDPEKRWFLGIQK